jgi:hypothetical protein
VAGDSGKVTKWTVEFAGRLNLSENGWADDTIKSGERVTVTGNPTHAEGTNRMAFKKLVRADGSELLPATAQRDSAIEEERRERAKGPPSQVAADLQVRPTAPTINFFSLERPLEAAGRS